MRKALVTTLALLAACTGGGVGTPTSDPHTLAPSADDRSSLARGNGAAYELFVDPRNGKADLIPLAPPDFATIFYTNFAVATSGTGSNTVTLHTDQTGVTYMTQDGTACFNNGASISCSTLSAPCNVPGTFCAPIQLTSNFTDPLPDVVLQVANKSGQANQVNSCTGDSAGSFGLCASNGSCPSGGNAAKVDCSTSALTSPVSGCSYCYSNAVGAGANVGLRDAVLPGVMPLSLSQDTVALKLANDSSFGVTLTVNYARPFLQPTVTLNDGGSTPSCATPNGTTITGTGGGFGPPSGCTSGSCPETGSPGSGYIVDFVQANNGTIVPATAGSVVWSDNTVSAQIDISASPNQGYAMRVRTPLNTTGVTSQSPAFSTCSMGVGGIDHFSVTVSGVPRVNRPVTFGVVALDAQNRRVTSYTGTITVSIAPDGTLNFAGAPNYTFTSCSGACDNGSHTFTGGATPATTGSHTIAVTDNAARPHTGSVTFNVSN